MNIQEMRGLVHDVVWYECHYGDRVASDAAEGLTWDVDATVEVITEYLLNRGTYDTVQNMVQWLAEEHIHLAALDWFSSYEPVLIRLETVK